MTSFKPVSVVLRNDYIQSTEDSIDKIFQDLLNACRSGDLERVESLVRNYSAPINKTDFWQCSPLYLACLCGHYKVVTFLLENGARCERDTFEGERCLYGALTSEIKQLLLDYKFSKAVDESQPYFKFLTLLYDQPLDTFSDVVFKLSSYEEIHAHRCILYIRSKFFANKLETIWRDHDVIEVLEPQWHPTCFRGILRYLYTSEIVAITKDLETQMISLCQHFELDSLTERYTENQISKKEVQVLDKLESQELRKDFEKFFKNNLLSKKYMKDDETSSNVTSSNNILNSRELQGFTQADICIQIEQEIFPCHKAFLTKRSEYFNVIITGPFAESQHKDTIYYENRRIPKITISDYCTPEIFALILEFIYTDKCDIPPNLSYQVLIEADKFLLDRLKSLASIILTNQSEPIEDIYTLMRAALDLNVDRLEQWCSRWFAEHIEEVLEDQRFLELIRESAHSIYKREETDSLPIIDDIRFWLSKKYGVLDNLDKNGRVNEDEESFTWEIEYNRILERIDKVLEQLELDA
ncbi:Substrate adaptor for cullin 3 ubiquitin ligase BTB3 [Gigaspora margarita]|uniref:Substrate adaptor for cullin 3 ubiquitin ligase BTB3 n=1 Tax=Gigaspora margarita TaxID=4874 RepID=A0A8H3ZW81_GIGMA|nr:Substrate adaptor for cullin 3 ubiquitin ligase BTB3 [Gigaspora margarita]